MYVQAGLQCLILNFVFHWMGGVYAARNKFFSVSDLCPAGEQNRTIYKTVDGAVLTSASGIRTEPHKCILTFQADSAEQKLMLRFEKLALPCHEHLYLYEESHTYGKNKEHLSCVSTLSSVSSTFTSHNYVTLIYEMGNGIGEFGQGFQLIITVFKDITSKCSDFKCMNHLCISEDLTCDGINHCADHSDELNSLCNGTRSRNLGTSLYSQGQAITFIEVEIVYGLLILVGSFA